ncbi:dihydropyrimidine dehydrogenase [Halobellus salinus]|uniref:Dihydropyrimidine dehydrogenase n=1 Tax=Halobellus salinus TaxID=931585 RepID=A0A830EE23_9EURY|nr:tRNA-dihydrouridine synthase [Halobellus salinus]GGJ16860.1 dihydropyrimidine dehydrogenase [Halobellus salinus]SMP31521.1 TIM-barrel protein, putative [Halobellus salinus]
MFAPRVALASLSGAADAAWARAGADHAGAAFLGGIAVDDQTREAARALVASDREEFLPPDPIGFVESQLDALADAPITPGVNVRAASPDAVSEAAAVCAARDAIVEINAHCRQAEMCAAGCGEALLRDPDRLRAFVAAAVGTGAPTSVKVRAEVAGVDLPATARTVTAAGADAIHVDAMDSEAVIQAVADAAPSLFVIANNEVRGRESVTEYLAYGADAVSIGRPSTEPAVRQRVRRAVDAWDSSEAGDPPRVDLGVDAQ